MNDTVQDICRPRERTKNARIIGDRIVGLGTKSLNKIDAPRANATAQSSREFEVWSHWRKCPPPPDLAHQIEEIARCRGIAPRKVLWALCREALAHRRGSS